MICSKKMKFAATTAAATAIVCTGAFAANVTSTTDVNVRSGPGNSYSVLTVMKKGTTTAQLGTSGGWTKVTVNGKTGYVYGKYLTGGGSSSTTPSTTTTTKTVYVTASSLNVRSGPSTSYGVIGGLSKGSSASVVGSSGSWYKIKYGSGYGYISSSYTSSSAPSSGSTTPSDTPSSSSFSKTMYCTTSGLNVRSGKGTAYSSKGVLSYGQAVTVVDSSSYWYKIEYGNGYGYVGSKYLSSSKPSSGSSTPITAPSNKVKTMYCTVSGLNVRSGAGTSYSSKGVLSYGQQVTVVNTSSYWYKIEYGSGYGYVGSSYLSSTKPSGGGSVSDDTPSTGSTSGSSIVSYAKTFLGCSYVYGGSGPSSFDCSGFTQYVYKHFGKSIPRTSASQYASCKKISKSSLQPGDLVFFTNGGSGVGHVAIYMGNGQIIHAANSSRGVCTDSLNSSYYTSHYVGAGRY